MGDHYDCDALAVYLRKQVHKYFFIFGIQRACRFVSQYHARLVHQRTRYGNALTLPAG